MFNGLKKFSKDIPVLVSNKTCKTFYLFYSSGLHTHNLKKHFKKYKHERFLQRIFSVRNRSTGLKFIRDNFKILQLITICVYPYMRWLISLNDTKITFLY